MTDHLTKKQRAILDEAWAAHNLGEDIASVCERLGKQHSMDPKEMGSLIVNLTLIDRQLRLIDEGKPASGETSVRPQSLLVSMMYAG